MYFHDKSFGSRLFDVFNTILMLLVVFVTLYPFYYIGTISLSDGNAVIRGEVRFLPVGFTLATYKRVLQGPFILRSLWNSVVYTTVGTFINLLMTALCAYPLARPYFSGRKFLTWMIMLTMFFSGGLVPSYLLVMQLGLLNTIWAIVLPGAISPWFMFILRTNLQSIPEEIYEASVIDGANDLQTMFRVILPLAKPVLATLLLFYAVGHWNSFFQALIYLDSRAMHPIQLILRNIVIAGQMAEQYEEMGAGSGQVVIVRTLRYATIMVATLPILAVYPFVQRYFVKGVMIGAIKG